MKTAFISEIKMNFFDGLGGVHTIQTAKKAVSPI